jgi:hypothetical protein
VAGFLEAVGSEPPSRMFGIRSGSSLSYTIVERSSNTTLETIEASRAFLRVYEGAVYLHEGCTFVVTEVRSSVWVPRTAVQPDLMPLPLCIDRPYACTARRARADCVAGAPYSQLLHGAARPHQACAPCLGAVWAAQGSPSLGRAELGLRCAAQCWSTHQ